MGGGRKTADNRNKEDIIIVYPSEIHSFAYCPRKYFFSLYMPAIPPFTTRLRMFLGTLFHLIKGVFSKMKGYKIEERIEYSLGNVKLRGRPDAFRKNGTQLEIIERKSGKGPRKGVWLSDSLQVTAYGLMLKGEHEDVLLKVEYRRASRISKLDSEKIGLLMRVLDDIVLVKKHGIVPYADKKPSKCLKCPFKEICDLLDEMKDPEGEEIYEPGSYIAEKRVDTSFIS